MVEEVEKLGSELKPLALSTHRQHLVHREVNVVDGRTAADGAPGVPDPAEQARVVTIEHCARGTRRLAVVGPATASVVRTTLRPPDFAPTVNTAEMLGEEITDVDNTRVLLPRGNLADDTLPAALRARGAFVDEVVVYRTVPGPGIAAIVAGVRESAVDALLFASASAVRFVADALVADTASTGLRRQRWPVAACLGPVTASAARACGFQSVIVADDATQNELIDAVARWFGAETGKGA